MADVAGIGPAAPWLRYEAVPPHRPSVPHVWYRLDIDAGAPAARVRLLAYPVGVAYPAGRTATTGNVVDQWTARADPAVLERLIVALRRSPFPGPPAEGPSHPVAAAPAVPPAARVRPYAETEADAASAEAPSAETASDTAPSAVVPCRVLSVEGILPVGRITVPWDLPREDPAEAARGYGELFRVLDAVLGQTAGATGGHGPYARPPGGLLPPVVHAAVREAGPGAAEDDGAGPAAFGVVGGRRVYAVAAAGRTIALRGERGAVVRTFSGPRAAVRAVALGRARGHSGPPPASAASTGPLPVASTSTTGGHPLPVGAHRDLLAASGDDRVLRVWDAATGQLLHARTGHLGPVRALAVPPSGRGPFASAGGDGDVRLWQAATGAATGTLAGHTGSVNAVAFADVDDGTVVVSAGDDTTIMVRDPGTGAVRRTLRGHTGWVRALACAVLRGRTLLASAAADRTVRLWDLRSGTTLHVLSGHLATVTGVALAVLGTRCVVVTGALDGTLRLWDAASGAQLHNLGVRAGLPPVGAPGADWVGALAGGALDGRPVVATGDGAGLVRLWDAADMAETGALRTLTGHTAAVTALAFGAAGARTLLASADAAGGVRVWDAATGAPLRTAAARSAVTSLAWTEVRDGPALLSAGDDGAITLWRPGGAGALEITPPAAQVRSLAFTSVGTPPGAAAGGAASGAEDAAVPRDVLVSGCLDGTVRTCDALTGEPLASAFAPGGPVGRLAVGGTPSAPVVAAATADGRVRLWDPGTGRALGEVAAHGRPVAAVACGTLGGALVVASAGCDGGVEVSAVGGGSPVIGNAAALARPGAAVRVLAFADVGGRGVLVVGRADGVVQLWAPARAAGGRRPCKRLRGGTDTAAGTGGLALLREVTLPEVPVAVAAAAEALEVGGDAGGVFHVTRS